MSGKPAPIHSRKTGPGWWNNSNAIRLSSRPPCLLCSVNDILSGIAPRRIAPCGGILPGGERSTDQNKTSSLNRSIRRENEHNRILRIWKSLPVTIAGEPFPHLVYHFVLTSSNVEAASICFSETFEALAE